MSLFNLSQACQEVFKENCYIWNSFRTRSVKICLKKLQNLQRYWSLKKNGINYKENLFTQANHKKLMEQSKDIKQKLKGKNSGICFSVIFSYEQSVISGKESGHLFLVS